MTEVNTETSNELDQLGLNGAIATLPDGPSDDEIEQFRKRGTALVAHRKEIAELQKKVNGLEFGSVKGASLSPMTQAMIAEFCFYVRANPAYHINLFGGQIFLNEKFWSDKINADPFFIRYEQRDLSPYVEDALRTQAAELRKEYEDLKSVAPEQAVQFRVRASEMEQQAREIAMARAQWGPREGAISVIETTIWRFMPATPLHLIQSGQMTDFSQYVQPVRECNWAGGRGVVTRRRRDGGTFEADGDPIGDAEPTKTARTRSLRRCAAKGFSTWAQAYDERVRKIEEIVEAQWEDVTPGRQINGRAMATGNGEPTATRALPQPLPQQDLTSLADQQRTAAPEHAQARTPRASEPRPEPQTDSRTDERSGGADVTGVTDDHRVAQRAFFGMLGDAGIKGDDARKAWQAEHDFPESTNDFTGGDFSRAKEILVRPEWDKLTDLCGQLGLESVREYVNANGREVPTTLREIKAEQARVMADLEKA